MIDEDQRKRHTKRSFKLLLIALTLFGLFVFALPIAAPLLNGYSFFRFPLGLFLAMQGAVVAIIAAIYWAAAKQDRLDRRYGLTSEL